MEELDFLCQKTDYIVIYGAGTISNILFFYLKDKGYKEKIKYFAVSDLKGNPENKFGIDVEIVDNISLVYKNALYIVATQKVLHKIIVEKLTVLGCSNLFCINPDVMIDKFYCKLYEYPIQNNKILFMNMAGLGYGGNPKYIAQKILELDKTKQCDLVWVVSDFSYNIPKDIRQVKIGTLEYYKELSTAHVWIDNLRKTFDVRKREGQYYIQAWHGAAPIKRVEKDAVEKLPETYIVNAINDSKMADLFISGSEFYTELYKRSFWYNGEIAQYGLPRQDVFWSKENIKEKVFNYFGISMDKSMVLYAPTFRSDFGTENYDLNIRAVLKALEYRFNKKFVCAISKHPDIRNIKYSFNKNDYIAVDKYDDFEELLAASDVLITDYSGCMYDFSFTGRPIFLYQKDYDKYIQDRNFYIPMDKLPYIKSESNKELCEKICDFDYDKYKLELSEFMYSMKNYDNGCAAEKIANIILNKILYDNRTTDSRTTAGRNCDELITK